MRQLKIRQQITNRKEGSSFEKYLSEIAKYDMLTAEEEVDLFKELELLNPERKWPEEIKDLDPETQIKIKKIIDRLSKANLRFVVSVAKQYQKSQIPLQDLINEWNIWLVKAIYRFDYTKWFKLISYAVWWIRQSILQYIAENSYIKIPMNQNGRISEVQKFVSAFQQRENGRIPTDEEIRDHFELSDTEFKNYMCAVLAKKTWSLDKKINNDDDGDDLQSILPNDWAESPDYNIIQETQANELMRILSRLPQKEQEIITMYYWIWKEREYSLEEIAWFLDISRERVRQIRNKTLKRLKHTMLLQKMNGTLNE